MASWASRGNMDNVTISGRLSWCNGYVYYMLITGQPHRILPCHLQSSALKRLAVRLIFLVQVNTFIPIFAPNLIGLSRFLFSILVVTAPTTHFLCSWHGSLSREKLGVVGVVTKRGWCGVAGCVEVSCGLPSD